MACAKEEAMLGGCTQARAGSPDRPNRCDAHRCVRHASSWWKKLIMSWVACRGAEQRQSTGKCRGCGQFGLSRRQRRQHRSRRFFDFCGPAECGNRRGCVPTPQHARFHSPLVPFVQYMFARVFHARVYTNLQCRQTSNMPLTRPTHM